jgi:hypothetical protein
MQLNCDQFALGTHGASCTATGGESILWTCEVKEDDGVPEILSEFARELNPGLRRSMIFG